MQVFLVRVNDSIVKVCATLRKARTQANGAMLGFGIFKEIETDRWTNSEDMRLSGNVQTIWIEPWKVT